MARTWTYHLFNASSMANLWDDLQRHMNDELQPTQTVFAHVVTSNQNWAGNRKYGVIFYLLDGFNLNQPPQDIDVPTVSSWNKQAYSDNDPTVLCDEIKNKLNQLATLDSGTKKYRDIFAKIAMADRDDVTPHFVLLSSD